MKNITAASDRLQNAIFDTLEHCAELKKDDDTPFIPFAIVTKNGESSMRAFYGESQGYGNQMFQTIIKEENPEIVVYAFDGYLTIEDKRTDAILVKAFEKDETEIFLVGQRYIPQNENASFQLTGNPVFMGTEECTVSNENNQISEVKKRPWWKF